MSGRSEVWGTPPPAMREDMKPWPAVSHATLDTSSASPRLRARLRDHLHERADFLGAIRLPNTAFKQNANTEVTTDIVFFRKLAEGERPNGPAWLNLAEHINDDGISFQINEYFAGNPHMMPGRIANEGTMYRQNEPALVPDGRNLKTPTVYDTDPKTGYPPPAVFASISLSGVKYLS
jgi:hypothetical protein